jgi:GT2 family glycosyltransferase
MLQPSEKLEIINNKVPAGFGTNHNAAFLRCSAPNFCVINPDITICRDLFPALIACQNVHKAALIAPMVLSPDGELEDSVRRFPTFLSLVSKAFGGPDGRYSFSKSHKPFTSECVAGMFMLFNAVAYKEIGGFDEHYYMYYEDIDICVRLWKAGLKVVVCPQASVTHAARRDSHRKWRFLLWHLVSMVRYFFSYGFRQQWLTCHKQEDRR